MGHVKFRKFVFRSSRQLWLRPEVQRLSNNASQDDDTKLGKVFGTAIQSQQRKNENMILRLQILDQTFSFNRTVVATLVWKQLRTADQDFLIRRSKISFWPKSPAEIGVEKVHKTLKYTFFAITLRLRKWDFSLFWSQFEAWFDSGIGEIRLRGQGHRARKPSRGPRRD